MFAWCQWSTGFTMPSGSITAANSNVAKVLEKWQKQSETKRPPGQYRIYTYYIIRIYKYGVEIFFCKCPTIISFWVTATMYILCTSTCYALRYSCDCLCAFISSFFEKLVNLHDFWKFIFEMFINSDFPKILPSKNFPLYGMVGKFDRRLNLTNLWLMMLASN